MAKAPGEGKPPLEEVFLEFSNNLLKYSVPALAKSLNSVLDSRLFFEERGLIS